MNYKIKINNEAESKEVQELFFELGCEWHGMGDEIIETLDVIVCENNFLTHCSLKFYSDYVKSHKELTIPQLRDLVVLKRNDVNDRNVIDPEFNESDLYLASDNSLYVFHIPTQAWKLSNLNGEEDVIQRLKPIEKPMQNTLDTGRDVVKEFLVNHDGKWSLQLLDADMEENSFRVAVPCGENFAYKSTRGSIVFMKTRDEIGSVRDSEIVWQRNKTKELVNDDVKVKHSHYKKDVSNYNFIDVYRVLDIFAVEHPCIQHAVKKLLCAGQRGSKGRDQDVQEAIDSLIRYQEMREEDNAST